MSFRMICLSVLLSTCTISVTLAEKVDMPPEKLRKTATHVIVGEVTAIYTKEKQEGHYKYTYFVAEVRTDNVEKGQGLKRGELVYIRYWQRRWTAGSFPPPNTNGHRGLPKEGQKLRIYLAQNAYDGFTNDNKDGGFNVIGANGFEALKKPAPGQKPAKSAPKAK